MKIGLFLFTFLLILVPLLHAGELPRELADNLTGIIKSQCPEAIIETKGGVFFAKSGTTIFTIHGRSKTGEFSEETRKQEGPNFRGFLLRISVEEGGPFNGQAVVPQTVHEVYWETYIDRPRTEDGRGYYHVSFSYGSRINGGLKKAILSAIPRTAKSLLKPCPESHVPITETTEAGAECRR